MQAVLSHSSNTELEVFWGAFGLDGEKFCNITIDGTVNPMYKDFVKGPVIHEPGNGDLYYGDDVSGGSVREESRDTVKTAEVDSQWVKSAESRGSVTGPSIENSQKNDKRMCI
jgi:hypothetical protein